MATLMAGLGRAAPPASMGLAIYSPEHIEGVQSMEHPPFRPALLPAAATWVGETVIPFNDEPAAVAPAAEASAARLRLRDMDAHLHCSIIGTCLSTAELRKLMARFIGVEGLSDLDVHHEAVRLASLDAEVARALHKALDRRHDSGVARFATARDAQALGRLWQQALAAGEVPAAYWALLTHRRATPELRQRAFGDVHMLSHLVGAANRADIRRLAALSKENGELKDRADAQQEKIARLQDEREQDRAARAAAEQRCSHLELQLAHAAAALPAANEAAYDGLARSVALQTRRREEAESRVRALAAEVERLEAERAAALNQAAELARELAASEAALHSRSADGDDGTAPALAQALAEALHGRALLYVGGRPSSSAAIRDLVLRHGGEFQRHDGGIEERKGLLAAALARASLVAFPVDCIDHDSALALKRACLRQSVPFLPLRTASVASFAAAVAAWARPPVPPPPPACGCGGPCLRHG
ncbi:MAG: DUF2325 domain-containing protein [Proteobacteria bacterium]|nr:DUF2325 domain-containing protein [Pseudomonadota bacterium]